MLTLPEFLEMADGKTPQKSQEQIAREHANIVRDMAWHDPVNHPKHYTQHPSGVECIQITEHMGFCLGNAVKYIWRADLKHDAIEDLEKAKWYLEREIALRKKTTSTPSK